MKTSVARSSTGYGKKESARGGLDGEGLLTSILGIGTGIVSCLPYRDGGLDLSLAMAGGYVECQSASVTGTRPGEGGWNVVENDSGEAGRV